MPWLSFALPNGDTHEEFLNVIDPNGTTTVPSTDYADAEPESSEPAIPFDTYVAWVTDELSRLRALNLSFEDRPLLDDHEWHVSLALEELAAARHGKVVHAWSLEVDASHVPNDIVDRTVRLLEGFNELRDALADDECAAVRREVLALVSAGIELSRFTWGVVDALREAHANIASPLAIASLFEQTASRAAEAVQQLKPTLDELEHRSDVRRLR